MEGEKRHVKEIVYQTDYNCDDCKEGTVIYCNPSGDLFSNARGTAYPHKCTNCNKEYTFFDVSYPITEKEYVEL